MGFWDKVGQAGSAILGGPAGYAAYKGATDDNWRKALIGSYGDPNRSRWQDADYLRNQSMQGIANAQSREAPQMQGAKIGSVAQMDTTRSDEFRARQMGLAGNLERVASGQQQGAGELAVQRQAQRAMANAGGAAQYGRGGSASSAARSSARAAGSIGLGAAGQSQEAALQDQSSARAQLAGVLGQGREQDIGIAGSNMSAENQRIFQQAGLDQATSLANMQARLQAMGMNDAAIQAYLQQIGAINAGEAGLRSADNGMLPQIASFGQQAAAAAGSRYTSDARVKINVREARAEVDELLDAIEPLTYEYTNETIGAGMWAGVMAQDMTKSSIGAELVVRSLDGEMLQVDKTKSISALWAVVARLNQRLRESEQRVADLLAAKAE